ncbi:lymphocyte antigen 75-like [Anticarsia gemmatalis]|uniref:lymphocyte antigen 75-like n=1 Tax=Anticarsia gemmatalis TaxID=129554 RepID=UPI003F774965
MYPPVLSVPSFTTFVLTLLGMRQENRFEFKPSINGTLEDNRNVLSWANALTQCRNEGAELAAPVTEQLRDEMLAFININKQPTPYFINAKLVHSQKPQFMSTEGVSLDDMPVDHMIDSLDLRDGECLAMDGSTIRVVSCTMPLPYICFRERGKKKMLECARTDNGYKAALSTGSCYKFHNERLNWFAAKSVCEAEGAHLVIINDRVEALTVRRHLVGSTGFYLFTGVIDKDTWFSVKGERETELYFVWSEGYNKTSRMTCATLNYSGLLDDFNCESYYYAFTCEMEAHWKTEEKAQ